MDLQNRIELCPAANGLTTAKFRRHDGREICLHSTIDPIEEARFLLQDVPVQERTLYVIIGFGLGYHVKELLRQLPPSCRVVVIESAGAPLSTMAGECFRGKSAKWFSDDRLRVIPFSNPEAVCISLANIFERNELISLEMFTHIPTVATDAEFYQQVIRTVPREFALRLTAQVNTLDTILENNLTNYLVNLPVTWRSPSVAGFENKWAGKPLIIVAAGPSLTDQLDQLKQAQGKAMIVCLGTAAKLLLEYGIRPDLVISIDPYVANMPHFIGWDTSAATLLYYQDVWREIPATFTGRKFWFTMQGENPIPLRPDFHNGPFSEGGTVAFSALQFAKYLKASPILFVGQDFAFRQGRTHADGIAHNFTYYEESLPEGFFRVPGAGGDLVITNRVYYSYMVFMQEYLRKNPEVKCISTSLTGAKIEGMDVLPLAEALKQFCREPLNVEQVIGQAYGSFKPVVAKNALALLSRWEGEIERFYRGNQQETDTDRLFSAFEKLEICQINHQHYRRFFYAVALREKWLKIPAEKPAAERLKAHAQFLLATIKQVKGELV